MQGAIAPATSNASFKSGQVGKSSQNLFANHTWLCDGQGPQSEVGPMEIKFERPISLVSLNIDLTFETVDSAHFLKQISHSNQFTEETKDATEPITTSKVEKPNVKAIEAENKVIT